MRGYQYLPRIMIRNLDATRPIDQRWLNQIGLERRSYPSVLHGLDTADVDAGCR